MNNRCKPHSIGPSDQSSSSRQLCACFINSLCASLLIPLLWQGPTQKHQYLSSSTWWCACDPVTKCRLDSFKLMVSMSRKGVRTHADAPCCARYCKAMHPLQSPQFLALIGLDGGRRYTQEEGSCIRAPIVQWHACSSIPSYSSDN